MCSGRAPAAISAGDLLGDRPRLGPVVLERGGLRHRLGAAVGCATAAGRRVSAPGRPRISRFAVSTTGAVER